MRKLFGVLAGIAVAFLIVATTDYISTLLFPTAALDTSDPDIVAAYIASLPLAAKLIVVSGWLIAPFGGAWLSLRIADWPTGGWIVTIMFLAGGLFNQYALPHPVWMLASALVLPLLGGWLAQRLHHTPYPGEPLLG